MFFAEPKRFTRSETHPPATLRDVSVCVHRLRVFPDSHLEEFLLLLHRFPVLPDAWMTRLGRPEAQTSQEEECEIVVVGAWGEEDCLSGKRTKERPTSEWVDGWGWGEVRGARRGGLREKSRGEVLPTANSKVLGTKWSRIRWRGGWGVDEKRTEIVDRWFWKGRTNFGRLDGRPLEFERTLASLPLAPATPPVIREPMLRSAMEKCY